MHRSKRESLERAYAAFNRRDIDAVLSLMSADVDWPNGMGGGRVFGHDQVRAYWTRQWSIMDPRVEPVNIEADQDGGIVVHVHQVVRDMSGTVLVDQLVEHVYHFNGELIDRMDIRTVDQN